MIPLPCSAPRAHALRLLGCLLLALATGGGACAADAAKATKKDRAAKKTEAAATAGKAAAADPFAARLPAEDAILRTLRPEHPRVMATSETWGRLKTTIAGGGLPARLYADLQAEARALLEAPVSKYEIPDGKRLLNVSRRVMDRVRTLALVDRLTGERRYAERAWRELEAAAAFKDWNPSHFLDTAEMTHAFALGYDWLFDRWTPEQRALLCAAIVEKGLKPGLKVYASGKGWAKNENNWNQVCNGGLISGALAIADREPALAARVVREAAASVPLAQRHYEPDGAGTEGVTYWSYGTRYNIVLLESLETALGTDFGLAREGALGKSGFYQIYLSGAGRMSFDFADCGRTRVSAPQHFWLARKFGEPAFSAFRLEALREDPKSGGALDLLWYDASGEGRDRGGLPLDRYFRGAECAVLRSAWTPDATIVAVQAGDSMNLGGHRHLDLGSFILDAKGERWIIDSGTEHETYLAHRHKNPRHAYYRVRAEGHNLPVLNPGKGPDQNPRAVARFARFETTPERGEAVVDLTAAYEAEAKGVTRTFRLDRAAGAAGAGGKLTIEDRIEARSPSELWWFLHTEAKVALRDGGRTAVLTRGGKTLTVRLEKPAAGAAFTTMPCAPLPTSPNPTPQASNKGRTKLALHLSGVGQTVVQVAFEP